MSGSPSPVADPLVNVERCRHAIPVAAGCVPCGTKAPTSAAHLRHHPFLMEPRYGREHAEALPNRRDYRSAGRTATSLRRATARARWTGHPLGMPTSYGRVIRPTRPETPAAAAHRARREAERLTATPRPTRAQRLAELRESLPHATRATLRDELRQGARAARRERRQRAAARARGADA